MGEFTWNLLSWGYPGDIMGISWGIMELVETFFFNVSFIFIGGELGQGMSGDGL